MMASAPLSASEGVGSGSGVVFAVDFRDFFGRGEGAATASSRFFGLRPFVARPDRRGSSIYNECQLSLTINECFGGIREPYA
jgi:hypothetical protein